MSAVESMDAPAEGGLVPAGAPVISGRVHLGRLRSQLPVGGPHTLAVGFGTVAWLGGPEMSVPAGLGQMVYRREVTADRRGRLTLDRHARSWLAVADTMAFDALVMAAPAGGLVVVPVEDFARRVKAVTP
jgi:hypothetical protein